ncbi:MAG: hydroxyacylglutathione hydrolase [Burkholderiaceae bacterium]
MEPIRAFSDNYIWLIRSPDGARAVVVDPGDAGPVIQRLEQQRLSLSAILLTHHHADHVGGVEALRKWANPTVYGPAGEDIDGVDEPLLDADRIDVAGLPMSLRVIEVPGHTRGHIAYAGDGYGGDARPLLFCGDTLFAAGCGRLFEGTPAQMLDSLDRLAALPPDTLVYCAHEYTVSNLRFAAAADPESAEVGQRLAEALRLRDADHETVPSSIAIERGTNPFLRSREACVRRHLPAELAPADADDVAFFAAVRRWKDNFR